MAEIREWEEYDGGPRDRHKGRMHVTLNRRGMLLLNRTAYDALGRPDAAKLLFDRRRKIIGVRAAEPNDLRPFTFKTYRNGSHRELQIHAFCVAYESVPTETIAFVNPTVDQNNILNLDLQNTRSATIDRKRTR